MAQIKPISGLEKISDYTGFSEKTLKTLKEEKGFPMIKFGHVWKAVPQKIDRWMAEKFDYTPQ